MKAEIDFLKEAILAADVAAEELDRARDSEYYREFHFQERKLRTEDATLYALLAIATDLRRIADVLCGASEQAAERRFG
jgi:hypothetical protein